MNRFINCRLSESLWSSCVQIASLLSRVVILRITILVRYFFIVVRPFDMMLIPVNWFNDIMVDLGFKFLDMSPRMLVFPLLELISILRTLWMHREVA